MKTTSSLLEAPDLFLLVERTRPLPGTETRRPGTPELGKEFPALLIRVKGAPGGFTGGPPGILNGCPTILPGRPSLLA